VLFGAVDDTRSPAIDGTARVQRNEATAAISTATIAAILPVDDEDEDEDEDEDVVTNGTLEYRRGEEREKRKFYR